MFLLAMAPILSEQGPIPMINPYNFDSSKYKHINTSNFSL